MPGELSRKPTGYPRLESHSPSNDSGLSTDNANWAQAGVSVEGVARDLCPIETGSRQDGLRSGMK